MLNRSIRLVNPHTIDIPVHILLERWFVGHDITKLLRCVMAWFIPCARFAILVVNIFTTWCPRGDPSHDSECRDLVLVRVR